MNNLLSYRGLVDAKIRASDKELPVQKDMNKFEMDLNRKKRNNRLHCAGSGVDKFTAAAGVAHWMDQS